MKEFLTSLVGVDTVEQQIDIARQKGGISSPEVLADKPPASVERVYRLADVAREYLAFVYTGNC